MYHNYICVWFWTYPEGLLFKPLGCCNKSHVEETCLSSLIFSAVDKSENIVGGILEIPQAAFQAHQKLHFINKCQNPRCLGSG